MRRSPASVPQRHLAPSAVAAACCMEALSVSSTPLNLARPSGGCAGAAQQGMNWPSERPPRFLDAPPRPIAEVAVAGHVGDPRRRRVCSGGVLFGQRKRRRFSTMMGPRSASAA